MKKHDLVWLAIVTVLALLAMDVRSTEAFTSPVVPWPTPEGCAENTVPCARYCGPPVSFANSPHRHVVVHAGPVSIPFYNCERISDLQCEVTDAATPQDWCTVPINTVGYTFRCIHDDLPAPQPEVFVSPLPAATAVPTPAPLPGEGWWLDDPWMGKYELWTNGVDYYVGGEILVSR